MEKLTDNNIITALECCYGGIKEDCENCPNRATCADIDVVESVIDLINRQKAEIERLQKTRKPTETSGFKLENGKIVFYVDLLGKYSHEFKDLNEVVEELNLMLAECYKTDEIAGYLKALQEQYKTAKAEAINEFAEQLEEAMKYDPATLKSYVTLSQVDNLVKEMVGDAE